MQRTGTLVGRIQELAPLVRGAVRGGRVLAAALLRPLTALRGAAIDRLRDWVLRAPVTSFRLEFAVAILGQLDPRLLTVLARARAEVDRAEAAAAHATASATGWREGAIAAAIAARRLPPALEDWARAYAHRDPEGFLEHLRTAPDSTAPGRRTDVDAARARLN